MNKDSSFSIPVRALTIVGFLVIAILTGLISILRVIFIAISLPAKGVEHFKSLLVI